MYSLCREERVQTVWIISRDTVLAKAIQIALREGGVCAEATILSDLPTPLPEASGWIVDLDALPATASIPVPAVTISRSPDLHPEADLLRPFLFREMVELARERFASPSLAAERAPRSSSAPFLKLLPEGVLMGGKRIPLSPCERALLALLMETPGECVPTEQMDALWQEKGGNTTAVYIRYLRKKLDEPSGLRLIRSVRGRGYCLCLPS
ncbi:MAG: winged helix-turn-helix domain-containing protein [Clostridia bacterium]|nr:winged helix-turn-helix domain-containing protein [Clostridia bacterium]